MVSRSKIRQSLHLGDLWRGKFVAGMEPSSSGNTTAQKKKSVRKGGSMDPGQMVYLSQVIYGNEKNMVTRKRPR